MTNWYIVVVGSLNAVRSYFGHSGVSSSCLLDYGKVTGYKEAKTKHARLEDLLMTSPWEGLSVGSLGVFLAQYVDVLRDSVPGVVCLGADEYASKILRELSAKQCNQSGKPRSPRSFPAKKVAKRDKQSGDSRDRSCGELVSEETASSTMCVAGCWSGSEDSLVVMRWKRKSFDLVKDFEDL